MKSLGSLENEFPIPGFHISAIIPTHESANFLKRCLKSLKEQSYPVYEIIVVDGFSKDNTQEIALKFGARVIMTPGTQAAARNLGLTCSKGDFILFVDSDQQLDDRVAEDCVLACLKYGADAVKVPEVFVGLNFWDKCSALWKNRMVKAWGSRGGIPRFYRRSVLTGSAAFDDRLRLWEDLELYHRLRLVGLKEVWCKHGVIHYEVDSLRTIIQKYVSYGRSVVAFRGKTINGPCVSAVRLTMSTLMCLLMNPGRSLSVLMGCLFLVAVKAISVAFGILPRLR